MAETKTAIKFDAEALAALDELKTIFKARFPVAWTRTSAAKHAIMRLRDHERDKHMASRLPVDKAPGAKKPARKRARAK